MSETIKIPFGEKVVVLKLSNYLDEELDIEELTSIQHHNIMGELLTISVALNRVGLLKAEAEREVSLKKLDLSIYEAQLSDEIRNEANTKGSKITIAEVASTVLQHKTFQKKKRMLIEAEKGYSYMESIYFAVKDKSRKLDALSSRLIPQEHEKEIVEGTVNGIMLKILEPGRVKKQ